MKPTLAVLTVYKTGSKYSKEYVDKLALMIAKHANGVPLYVITDSNEQFDPTVKIIYKPDLLPGWWAKTEIFNPDLLLQRVLFLDLSVVITSSLFPFLERKEPVLITKDFYYGTPSQSVLLYDIGAFEKTYQSFLAAPKEWMALGDRCIAPNFGDQVLMNATFTPKMTYWQDIFENKLCSYKVHIQGREIPPECAIIKFHGNPKPAEVDWLGLY